MAFSFSTSGSTPQVNPLSQGSLNLVGTTPQAKALNNAANPFSSPASRMEGNIGSAIGSTFSANTQQPTSSNGFGGNFPTTPQPGLLTPQPSTPLKKQTQTNVDGSSVTHEFHAPVVPATEGQNASTTAPVSTAPPAGTANGFVDKSQQSQQTPQPSAFSGFVNDAATAAKRNATVGQNAADIAADYGKKIAAVGDQAAGLENTYNTTPGMLLPNAQGLAQNVANTAAAKQTALAAGEQAALQGTGQQLTAQQQQQTGLLGAGGLAKPETAAFGQTVFNPATEQYENSGGGNLDPQSQASQLAQLVSSGQMDYNTAVTQMGQYGAAGVPALRNAILSKNPNFNFNLSQSSAQTQAIGQQIAAAIPPANQALDTLQNAFNALPKLESTSIPILNQFTQGAAMASGIGRDQASAFQGALNEARARIDGALQGVIGVDAAAAQATALLPDNMIPSEIPQKIAAAKQYLQNQVQSYTQSGQQGQSGGSSGAPMFGSFN